MQVDAEVRAYDALSQHPRVADLTDVARSLMTAAVQLKRVERRAEQVAKLAGELGLGREDAATPFGNALDVLQRGPEDDAERALACALAGQTLALHPPKDADQASAQAGDLLWLATNTAFDATGLVDRALGDRANLLWSAVADRVRRIDHGSAGGRGEALVGALALAASTSEDAARHAAALASETRDRKLARALRARIGGGSTETPIACEMAPAPRTPAATALLALTGVLLAVHLARLFGKFALAYRRPAEMTLTDDGGGDPALRIRWRVELLGRTLRDRNVIIPRAGLLRVAREARYPRPALYAGLLSLAVGSYLGLATFADGVRAASPSLLASGAAIVAIGLAVDFALSSLWPGLRGNCRVLFVPRGGRPLCVGGIPLERADAVLTKLIRSSTR